MKFFSKGKIIIGILAVAVIVLVIWWHGRPEAKFSQMKFTAVIDKPAELLAMVQAIGVKETMQKLVDESKGGSAFDCHQQAHEVGRVAYRVDKEQAFAECDSSCHSGCYHGAMEGLLHEKGSKNLSADVNEACKIFSTRFGTFECFHGVGHGLLAYEGYDLPKSIADCGRLDTPEHSQFCMSGLFMENIVTAQGMGAAKGTHATTWVNRTDPLFPCDALSKDPTIQFTCYQMQTSWMLTMFNYDFKPVAEACLTAPKEMIPTCFESFGRDAAGQTLRDPQKILDICKKAPDEYFNQCISGGVQVIIDFWGPGLKDQAGGLCRLLPEEHKAACYSVVAGRMQDIFPIINGVVPAGRKTVCASFEDRYRSLCEQ